MSIRSALFNPGISFRVVFRDIPIIALCFPGLSGEVYIIIL